MMRAPASLLMLAVLAGCATRPSAVRVSAVIAPGDTFDGSPFRVPTEQIRQVWALDPTKGTYAKVFQQHVVLGDQQRLYAMDVVSGPFASPALHVVENPDNTIKSVQVTTSGNASGAIDATTGILTGGVTQKNSNYVACQTARAAVTTQNQAVGTAQAAYDALPATASKELRAAYQEIIDKAQAAATFANANPQC